MSLFLKMQRCKEASKFDEDNEDGDASLQNVASYEGCLLVIDKGCK